MRRPSRILKLFVWVGVLLAVGVGFCILLVVGFVGTRLLVSNGVDQFTGEERVAAQEALLSVQIGCLDNPIARLVIPKIRVVKMRLESEHCPAVHPSVGQDYRVVLRIYTFFGIPVGTASVCVRGGSVDCRGLLWPRRP